MIAKEPADVRPADVFLFLTEQRSPRRGDGEVGLSARTLRRRLSSDTSVSSVCVAMTVRLGSSIRPTGSSGGEAGSAFGVGCPPGSRRGRCQVSPDAQAVTTHHVKKCWFVAK